MTLISRFTHTSSRQGEIAEVVFSHGWDYMRSLLSGTRTDEPDLPAPEVLRNILIDLGPVYVKLGQLLSTRPDLLPADYIDALSSLQDEVPPVSWIEIEKVLVREIPLPLEEVFSVIQTDAIAAGSIAQIHRATLRDGRNVALKVQRPGINLIVEQDIDLILGIADLVSRTSFGQDYDMKALAKEFISALRDELDFTLEAEFTDRLRHNMSQSQWIESDRLVIPKIEWDLTTPDLLVMEWIEGVPLLTAEIADPDQNGAVSAERRSITRLLFRAFLQQIYVDGFFHADPHPGNLFYMGEGRVALLDSGMIGKLDPNSQRILTEMLLAIIDLDAQRCSQLTLRLAESSQAVNLPGLENDYERMLRKYYNRSLAEIPFSRVFYEVLQIARNNRIKLPSNMGLYAKALANLEGVARSFDPEVNLLDEIRPLMNDLFQRQLVGDRPLQTLLRMALDLKYLSLQSPRQIEQLLNRFSSETLQWNVSLREMDGMRLTLDAAANRLSFSILVGSLIMGAAIVSSNQQPAQVIWLSSALFAAASFLGFWLIINILRAGRLR